MKMKSFIRIIACLILVSLVEGKSQDYGRHLELSLLFYECQRSGPLPKTNRIYWRHDSMVDAGADVGVDLTGGYYDAGDNIKFNFPQASSITLLAWSGVDFADGYKKAGQYEYLLDAVKWGTDYFIKCHTGKNELYVQVGNGSIDHGDWIAPEYMQYKYPSYKIDASKPGSDVAAETAAALAAASLLFKETDSAYSATCLKHAIEIYDFADEYRESYHISVKEAQGYYSSFNGYIDELAWGAAWLLRATGEEKYNEKYSAIADKEYGEWDRNKYTGCTGPISWDDKRPGAYILIAMVTKEEKRMKVAYDYCDAILKGPKTKGGLWYDTQLSMWASNRYAANAASMVGMFASILPETDSKRKAYIDFVKSQIDYILGDNPAKVNYVVGAEENSPKAVHHRGASGTYGAEDSCIPPFNVFTLYGALAGGPGADDSYKDSRSNFQMNEVALDYNAGFTMCLAELLHFGLGTKDGPLKFDRAWPQRSMVPDISISMDTTGFKLSTGSNMICGSWCVSWTSDEDFGNIYHGAVIKAEKPNYTVCNDRDTGFLDGDGGVQYASFNIMGDFTPPTEFEVLCDGYHFGKPPVYLPEYGHKYKVVAPGGPENTTPLFENGDCWPSHIC